VRKGTFFSAACAFAVAIAAVGCGSGSGGSGGSGDEVTASSITKAQYIKDAGAICEGATKRIKVDFGVYLREEGDEEAKASAAHYADLVDAVFAPNVEQEIEELRELGAPKQDVSTVEAMVKAREEALAAVEADPKSLTTNQPFEKSIKAAKDYGLAACAVP
jgi:hypothetical protein